MNRYRFIKLLKEARVTVAEFAKKIDRAVSTLKTAARTNTFSPGLVGAIEKYKISFEPIELMIMMDHRIEGNFQPLREDHVFALSTTQYIYTDKKFTESMAIDIVKKVVENDIKIHEKDLKKNWSTHNYYPHNYGAMLFNFTFCSKGMEYKCKDYIQSALDDEPRVPNDMKSMIIGVLENPQYEFKILTSEETNIHMGKFLVPEGLTLCDDEIAHHCKIKSNLAGPNYPQFDGNIEALLKSNGL
jgi:hypothetical protein